MKANLYLLAVLIVTGLTSCPETKVPRDFGLKPAVLKPAEWEGEWASASNPDETLRFSIASAERGLLNVTAPEKKGQNRATIEAIVRHQTDDKDSRLFFLLTFEKTGDAIASINLVAKPDANLFNLWGPNNAAIEKAIASGKLKGTIKKDKDGDHCSLAADPQNYQVLGGPDFWEWSKPEAFFKEPSVELQKPN